MTDPIGQASARMTAAFDAAKKNPTPAAWQEARWAVDAFADACREAGHTWGRGVALGAQRAIDRHQAAGVVDNA